MQLKLGLRREQKVVGLALSSPTGNQKAMGDSWVCLFCDSQLHCHQALGLGVEFALQWGGEPLPW